MRTKLRNYLIQGFDNLTQNLHGMTVQDKRLRMSLVNKDIKSICLLLLNTGKGRKHDIVCSESYNKKFCAAGV